LKGILAVIYLQPCISYGLPKFSLMYTKHLCSTTSSHFFSSFPFPIIGGRQQFCISQTGSTSNVVVFGSLALRSFYAVFHMKMNRVGLANKEAFEASNIQCKALVHCFGMQTIDATRNVCMPPPCEDYYFFTLDESTQECSLVSTNCQMLFGCCHFRCCRIVCEYIFSLALVFSSCLTRSTFLLSSCTDCIIPYPRHHGYLWVCAR